MASIEFEKCFKIWSRCLHFLKGKHHSSEETNEARLGDKLHYGMEMYHARLKQFARLQNTSLLEKIGPYVKNVTAAINCFRPSIFQSSDRNKEEKFVRIIKSSVKVNNKL